MNKQQFSQFIAEHFECSPEAAKAIIDIFSESICLAISEGKTVELENLGNFKTRHVPLRTNRHFNANFRNHPNNNSKPEPHSKFYPYFVPSPSLKLACNS